MSEPDLITRVEEAARKAHGARFSGWFAFEGGKYFLIDGASAQRIARKVFGPPQPEQQQREREVTR
jgi:hypothetical protein